jgi:hypothetical protein
MHAFLSPLKALKILDVALFLLLKQYNYLNGRPASMLFNSKSVKKLFQYPPVSG